jgi:hypothetical protein
MTAIFDHTCPHLTLQQALKVEFTLPKWGWIRCRLHPLHELYAISCTHIWDPFGDMIHWLEQIADEHEAATWSINQEGDCSRLQFYGANGTIDDPSDYLLHIQTSGSIDRVRGVKVDRRQLVSSFYLAFRAMVEDPAYSARHWECHPDFDLFDDMDDEAYDAAINAHPYRGLALRTLRSPTIEEHLKRWTEAEPQPQQD